MKKGKSFIALLPQLNLVSEILFALKEAGFSEDNCQAAILAMNIANIDDIGITNLIENADYEANFVTAALPFVRSEGLKNIILEKTGL